ncbi:MAG TPA: PAS domain S-box protein [Pyrinomonadaceae bacterium]|jgi:PAS domain S-box-containing protein|nr:PAS domain S-box protein [Pyrinomonadaceae bacterium]
MASPPDHEKSREQLLAELADARARLDALGRAFESARLPALLPDSVGQAVIASDAGGKIIYWNREAERLYGWQAGEVLGRDIVEVTPSDVSREQAAEIMRRLGAGESWTGEFMVRRRDGSCFPALVTDTPIFEDGRLTGVVGVSVDITSQKRMEEERERLLRERQALLDSTTEGIFGMDGDGACVFTNQAAAAMIGRPADEILGRTLHALVHHTRPDGSPYPVEECPLYQASQRGEAARVEDDIFWRADGTHFPAEYAVAPVLMDGRVRGSVVTVRDVTRRRRAESELREAQQRALRQYETLLNRLTHLAESLGTARDHLTVFRDLRDFAVVSVPCIGIFISLYDAERDARTARYGWGDGEEVDVSQLPPMPVSADGPNSRAVRTGQVVITNDYWELKQKGRGQMGVLVGPDNGLRPQSSLVVPMAMMGRIVGTVEVQSYDNHAYRQEHVTAMKMAANLAAVAIENMRLLEFETRARAEAEEANRLKDEFLATLSHELRTPLTAILGWAHMLREERVDEATHAAAVEIIERNARTQQQIVDDILDVSRIITGQLRLEPELLDVRSVVEAAADTVRPAATARSIRLDLRFDPRPVPVTADPRRLQQVVWNLLSNAVKFTPQGGEVRVRTEVAGGHLRLSVEDTGAGIRPDFLPYVFDRFRQGDQSTTRTHGGLGLGLAIVRHLVELQGGTVWAASPGVGKGASFTIELPLQELRVEAGGPRNDGSDGDGDSAGRSPQSAILKGLRVLVVDDEPDALDLIKVVLERGGASVTAVGSAAEAMTSLEEASPDVMLCDIGMPNEDGYGLVRRVRALGPERGGLTPAIALTAYAGEADRDLALEAGFQLHVPKPIDPARLVELVAGLAVKVRG